MVSCKPAKRPYITEINPTTQSCKGLRKPRTMNIAGQIILPEYLQTVKDRINLIPILKCTRTMRKIKATRGFQLCCRCRSEGGRNTHNCATNPAMDYVSGCQENFGRVYCRFTVATPATCVKRIIVNSNNPTRHLCRHKQYSIFS